jgi:hypothetical protein
MLELGLDLDLCGYRMVYGARELESRSEITSSPDTSAPALGPTHSSFEWTKQPERGFHEWPPSGTEVENERRLPLLSLHGGCGTTFTFYLYRNSVA